MIEKGAITEVECPTAEGFVSRLFLVPKKDGQRRPVINLKPLNRFLVYRHFKGYPGCGGCAPPQRLVDKNRSQRCLFHDPGPSESPEVFEVQMDKENVPILMPTSFLLAVPKHEQTLASVSTLSSPVASKLTLSLVGGSVSLLWNR